MTNFDKKLFAEWDSAGASMVKVFILLLLVCMMCGCRSVRYVPVESVRTEYKDRVNTEYVVDSVTDTRFVFVKGDTVIDYRDRVKWRDREVHDSIYINKTDTIRVPYPVERKLTKWQQVKMDFGGIAFGGVVMAAVVIALMAWLARKRRK